MQPPQPDDINSYRERIMEGLRAFGSNYTDFTRRFAASLGVHSTDAVALMEIFYAEDIDAPLSPARLSERISLTSGATTALLNRLEEAGYIVRSREHTDRRIVTLHSGPNIGTPARAFFQPLTDHMNAMCTQYPTELLQEFEAFLNHLRRTMTDVLAEQDGSA